MPAENISDEQFFKQRGFGQRIGFGQRPALMVIDILNAFTDPDMPLGANLDPQIAAILPLLDVARSKKLPVLFSTVRYDDDDLKDAGIWALKQKGIVTLRAGTPGVEVDARMGFRRGETLIADRKSVV